MQRRMPLESSPNLRLLKDNVKKPKQPHRKKDLNLNKLRTH